MPVKITLSWLELMQAAQIGVARRISSMKHRRNCNVHAYKSDWATDIDGAAAELAVAKHTRSWWPVDTNDFKAPDVAHYHIRSTKTVNGHLIVRNNDPASGEYVLVITNAPEFTIIGSISGEVAKQECWRNTTNSFGVESWWIPQSALQDWSSNETESV